MEVINLGNFGPRRQSPYADVPNALQEGLRTGIQQGGEIAKIKSMQENKAVQLQELKIKQAELTRQLDKDALDKELKQSEHGLVVADNLSNRLDTMDPQMRAVTLQSPPIKSVTDGLKKTNPELFDDTGNFVGRSSKTRIETQIQQHRNEAINTVETLTKKAQAQGGLDENEMRALNGAVLTSKIYHNSNMKDISEFMQEHMAKKTPSQDLGAAFMNLPFMKKITGMMPGQNNQPEPSPMTEALATTPQQPGVPAQGGGSTNPNDPAGILSQSA